MFFFSVLVAQLLFSFSVRPLRQFFEAVPPVPTEASASVKYLGDDELAYRSYGMMIQNFGTTGGHNVALKDYNFERLARWFFLEHSLDSRSDFIPFLASYYFGASQDPSKLYPVLDYLEVAGNSSKDEKWRWMGQAVYLARFRMNDNDKALELAYKLSDLYVTGMPAWTKQMPAFVQLNMGEKDAANAFMREILISDSERMHPNEVNFMVDYICNRTLDASQSKKDPLCAEFH
ncbi:MAG: hypothetical protein ACPG05_04110 [Bdellovibrionales bacterium]